MGRNGDRPPWDEDPMGHSGTVGTGSYETETPWGTMGTDPHGMKTPKSIWEWWRWDPMRPTPHGAQWEQISMGWRPHGAQWHSGDGIL